MVAKVLFSTPQRSTHHISAGRGRSPVAHSDLPIPLTGIGQGNGLGLSLWALISTILLDMITRAGHRVNLSLAISEQQLHLVGFSFVDDIDLVTALTPNTPGKRILPEFWQSLDRWAGGLVATGGELAPNKSFCCLLDCKWSNDRWDCRSLEEMPGDVTVKDKHGVSHPLR